MALARSVFRLSAGDSVCSLQIKLPACINLGKLNVHKPTSSWRNFSSRTTATIKNAGKSRSLSLLELSRSLRTNTANTTSRLILAQRSYSTNTPPTDSQASPTPKPKLLEKTATKIVAAKNAARSVLQDTKRKIPQHENIYTLPNFLTVTRIISAPVIGYLVVHQQLAWAVGLFAYSCFTDFIDGWIARHYKLQTVVGSVIDPMADKILMITLASCLAASGDIPMYMAVLILGRDIMLGFSALYYRYISLPPPKTFTRYWDFSIPSAEVHPTTISKYNTFFQMLYLGSSLVFPVLMETIAGTPYASSVQTGMTIMEYTVATTTVLSGLSYVFSKNAVKILNKP